MPRKQAGKKQAKAGGGPKAQQPLAAKPPAADEQPKSAAPQEQQGKGGKGRLVRQFFVEASGEPAAEVAAAAAAAPEPAPASRPDSASDHDAAAAAAAAAAVVSDDEGPVDEPADPRDMSAAHAAAAKRLEDERDLRAAVGLYSKAIEGAPDNPQLYVSRCWCLMELQQEREAIVDATIALELPGGQQHASMRYLAPLFRAWTKQELGDLEGAAVDAKAAMAAAPSESERERATATMRSVVARKVKVAQQAQQARAQERPVHSYRGGTAIIEEISAENGEALAEETRMRRAHEMALTWQEAAARIVSEARAKARRQAQALQAARAAAREEEQKRADRNAVRAARRRSAERAQQAAAAAQQRQQGQQRQEVEVVERTRIPIEVVEGGACACSDAGRSSSSDGRSTHSRLAGDETESEAESEGEVSAVPPAAAAAKEPASAAVAAAAAAAEGQRTADAAIRASAASSATAVEEPPAGALAAEAAAAELAGGAPANEGLGSDEDERAEAAGAAAEPAAAAEAAAKEPEAPEAAALPTDAELDALKAQADGLQRQRQHEQAERLYARYLQLRPTDVRAWSNRAENCTQAGQITEALQHCNTALAVATPSHALPRHKLLIRRSMAYEKGGRLQEALRDMEAAEAAVEEEGEGLEGSLKVPKEAIAKRTRKVLAEMAARGIQPAPGGSAATLGMHASAAGGPLGLPHVPVAPEQPAPDSSAVGVGGQEEQEAAAAAAGAGGAAGPSPQDVQAANEARDRGNTCFTKRQYEQAVGHYRRATQLDPSSKFSWSNLAAALLQLRRWDEAVDACDAALELDPHFDKAHYRRALGYAGGRRWSQAVWEIEMALEQLAEGARERAAMLKLRDDWAEKQRLDEQGLLQSCSL